jgi:pimeloyl-ACP methyl ester carboxylesterase
MIHAPMVRAEALIARLGSMKNATCQHISIQQYHGFPIQVRMQCLGAR